ncbi:MAG TPA: hypothetical protein PKH94_10065 [Bacteroidales bacterium]|nr:hypothetical protein [Bacteroidales bacterium]HNS47575.1 hypothetical protein [Bacteroidales bacterium]
MSQFYFKETQRFRQPWVWLIVLLTAAIIAFFFVTMFAQDGSTTAEDKAPVFILILIPLILIGSCALLLITKLETEIRRDGIHYRFPPFINRTRIQRWEDIKEYRVRKYSPIGEYGGWGYRMGGKKAGVAYNISGNMGLQLELKNGKKILLGTRKPTELEDVLKKVQRTENQSF